MKGIVQTAGALLIFALAAAAVAIGWRWGQKIQGPGL